MKNNWASIIGNVDIKDDSITLIPVPPPPNTTNIQDQPPVAVVRSDIEFEQGSIEFEAFLPESSARCQIGIEGSSSIEIYAGLNVLGAPYGFAKINNFQWEPIAGAGHGGLIEAKKWHKMKLSVKGSNLDLFFNNVKVVSTSQQIVRGTIGLFLQSPEPVSVKNIKVQTLAPICFIVMQFTDEFNSLYEEVIKPTCEEFGYKVIRADDYYNSGLIIDDITRSIRECAVVIADITPNNPNVFYEVGFAHGIDKPTILLSNRNRETLPFDISGFRTLFYENTIGGKTAVEERLRKHLESLSA